MSIIDQIFLPGSELSWLKVSDTIIVKCLMYSSVSRFELMCPQRKKDKWKIIFLKIVSLQIFASNCELI